MCDVMSPGQPAFPVLCLQRDEVSGSRRLSDPNFKLHPVLTHALGEAHLTRLQKGKDGKAKMKRQTGRASGKDRREWKNLTKIQC